jgi:hypothetical protein
MDRDNFHLYTYEANKKLANCISSSVCYLLKCYKQSKTDFENGILHNAYGYNIGQIKKIPA